MNTCIIIAGLILTACYILPLFMTIELLIYKLENLQGWVFKPRLAESRPRPHFKAPTLPVEPSRLVSNI